MRRFLDGFLPRLMPGITFLCIEHEGKADLERSIPRKLRAWNVPDDRFMIIRDSDSAPPGDLEVKLGNICARAGRNDVPVCIAYQELEAWYLGDLRALAAAFNVNLRAHYGKALYRNPDIIGSPSDIIKKLVPQFQKVNGARLMGRALSMDSNTSPSFSQTCGALHRLAA